MKIDNEGMESKNEVLNSQDAESAEHWDHWSSLILQNEADRRQGRTWCSYVQSQALIIE